MTDAHEDLTLQDDDTRLYQLICEGTCNPQRYATELAVERDILTHGWPCDYSATTRTLLRSLRHTPHRVLQAAGRYADRQMMCCVCGAKRRF